MNRRRFFFVVVFKTRSPRNQGYKVVRKEQETSPCRECEVSANLPLLCGHRSLCLLNPQVDSLAKPCAAHPWLTASSLKGALGEDLQVPVGILLIWLKYLHIEIAPTSMCRAKLLQVSLCFDVEMHACLPPWVLILNLI